MITINAFFQVCILLKRLYGDYLCLESQNLNGEGVNLSINITAGIDEKWSYRTGVFYILLSLCGIHRQFSS